MIIEYMKNVLKIKILFILRKIKKVLLDIISAIKYFFKYTIIEKLNIKHFGNDFPDKIFYIVRRCPPGAGLLSNFHYVLNHAAYAISKKYIPIVDMENYKTFYNENFPIETGKGETLNAWEYYFEQPFGYSLKNIENAKNVILADLNDAGMADYFLDPYHISKSRIEKYYTFVSQYCKFNQITAEHIDKQKEILFGNKTNILGVLHRGTDMKTAKNHQTPASIEQTLQKVQQVFQDEKFDYIFLCTEEQKAVDEFFMAFKKEHIITSDIQRIKEYDSGTIPYIIQKKSLSVYKEGLNYLSDMYLLSKCDGIVAPKVNGTYFALGLNNNKYRFSYLFDFGVNL